MKMATPPVARLAECFNFRSVEVRARQDLPHATILVSTTIKTDARSRPATQADAAWAGGEDVAPAAIRQRTSILELVYRGRGGGDGGGDGGDGGSGGRRASS
jgi:hypothetical protein